MIEPIDFLNFSEKLLDGTGGEIVIRNSISRAYYYVFHHVRENYETQLEKFKKKLRRDTGRYFNDHIVVVKFFENVGERNLASRIHSLHVERNKADYDLWRNFEGDTAEEFITDVKTFIYDFNYFRNSSRT